MEFDSRTHNTRHGSGALEINMQSRARERELAKSIANLHGKHESREKNAQTHSKNFLSQLLSSVKIF